MPSADPKRDVLLLRTAGVHDGLSAGAGRRIDRPDWGRASDDVAVIPIEPAAADIFETWISENDADVREAAGL
jgi:hypothetical protein